MATTYLCPNDEAKLNPNPAFLHIYQCPICGLAVTQEDAEAYIMETGGDADERTSG